MPRPTKTGIDYFPLDVQLEDKIKLLEAKYGMEGFGLWVKLLQKIYQHNYYIKWSEEKELLFKNEVNVDINTIKELINDCLKWGIFDKKLYEKYNIITSRGIQKRYFEAVKRRNEVEVKKNYLLLNGNNEYKNWVYVNNNPKKENDNSQSKVKESKVKESIKRPSDKSDKQTDEFSIKKLDNGRYNYPDEYERIYSLYPKNKGTKKSGWRKWAARRRGGVEQKDLIEAVKNYAAECQRENRDKKYVKHLSTFLGPDEHWREYLIKNHTGKGGKNGFSEDSRKEKEETEQEESIFNTG